VKYFLPQPKEEGMPRWRTLAAFGLLTVAPLARLTKISLGLGAHAAFRKMTDSAKPFAIARQLDRTDGMVARMALVIGNGHYPDAETPLTQPIDDARDLSKILHRSGFDVIAVEDAKKTDINAAVDRLKSKIDYNTMVTVDAEIWKESDVERDAVSIESVLSQLKQVSAGAELVVIDASRLNPFERQFRGYSHGAAPTNASRNSLIATSAMPDKIAEDSNGRNSMFISELLESLSEPPRNAKAIFNDAMSEVARKSDGVQIPMVSSSMVGDVLLGVPTEQTNK
jgi:uncharacterized caspase-like protein